MNDAFQVLKNKIPSCGLNTNVTKMTILHEGKDDYGLVYDRNEIVGILCRGMRLQF